MSVINHTYNSDKIDSLKSVLLSKAQKGKPADYEIRVDGLAVVSRTNEVEQFDDYKEHVRDFTHIVSVLLYEGQSRNNTHHMFIRPTEVKKQWQDINPQEVINEKIEHEKKKWENEQLKKEVERLSKKVEEERTKKEEKAELVEELQSKIRHRDANWGSIASYAVEGVVRRGIPFIAKFPGAEGLAKLLEENDQMAEGERESYFFKKKAKKSIVPENTPLPTQNHVRTEVAESSDTLNIAQMLEKEFSKEKMGAISEILVALAKQPESIEAAQAFLNQKDGAPQVANKAKRIAAVKAIAAKLNGLYHSTLEWVKQKYRLIIFYVKCIKYLKRMK